MRLLLIGPCTGLPRFNADEFARVAAELRAQGHLVVSPIEIDVEHGLDVDGPPMSPEWVQEARRRCLAVLVAGEPMAIGGCVALTGWWRGFGRTEISLARALGIAVYDEWMKPLDEVEM